MSDIGREIKRLREERGWTQAQLAVYAESSQPTVNQVESGKRNPSTRTLEKLARALGVEVSVLFPKAQSALPLEDADGRRALEEARAEVREETLREIEEQDAQLGKKWAALAEASIKQLETLLHTHLELAAKEQDAALAEAHRKLAGEWLRRGWGSMFLLLRQAAHDAPAFDVPELKLAFGRGRERVLEFSQPYPTDLAELEETAEWLEEKPRTR
jgi:transcriptional regulator with XRE-family HTH domain